MRERCEKVVHSGRPALSPSTQGRVSFMCVKRSSRDAGIVTPSPESSRSDPKPLRLREPIPPKCNQAQRDRWNRARAVSETLRIQISSKAAGHPREGRTVDFSLGNGAERKVMNRIRRRFVARLGIFQVETATPSLEKDRRTAAPAPGRSTGRSASRPRSVSGLLLQRLESAPPSCGLCPRRSPSPHGGPRPEGSVAPATARSHQRS